MPLQRREPKDDACPHGQTQAPRAERPPEEQEDEGQPGSDGDQVQVSKMNDEQVREHVGDGSRQGCRDAKRTAGLKVAQAEVHEQPGQKNMQDHHPL